MSQTLWYRCTVAQKTKSRVNQSSLQPEKVIIQEVYITLSSCEYELNMHLQIAIELCMPLAKSMQQSELIKINFQALYLIEELFSRCTWLNCELQLGIHSRDTNI